MYHIIRLTILIFVFKTILSRSNQTVLNTNAQLYRDVFADYQKETGPWRNATELVTVVMSSQLYTIDCVVG